MGQTSTPEALDQELVPISDAELEEARALALSRDPVTGQFLPGKSGNPKGRARGARNRITLARLLVEEAMRKKLENHQSKLLDKAISMALEGNDRIMRALLDKMLTTPKETDEADIGDKEIRVIINNLTAPAPEPSPGKRTFSATATAVVTATPTTIPSISTPKDQ